MSVTFDETMQKLMSNYLVAVNRLRHAQSRGPGMADPDSLRTMMAEESRAEHDCLQALVQRGWQPPFALKRGA